MHIIYISKIPVYPVNGGEQIRSHGLIQLLSEYSDNLSVIIPHDNSISDCTPENTKIYNYKFSHKHQIFPFYREKKIIKLISKINKNRNVDLAFIDYHFFGQYIGYFKQKGVKVIYGTHNSQANLVLHRKYGNVFGRLFNYGYFNLVRFHEKFYFNKADKLVVVSNQDKIYHSKFVDVHKITIIPNFLDKKKYNKFITKNKQNDLITFCANFLSFQNIEGFKWFIKNVWKKPINSSYRLLLVGRGSKKIISSKEFSHVSNIEATGEVESVCEYLAISKLSIVPLLHGSGSRLKCLESMALKTQLLTTTKGIEGILHDGKVLIADSDTEFIAKIESAMTSSVDMTDDAYEIFNNNYSKEACRSIVRDLINFN